MSPFRTEGERSRSAAGAKPPVASDRASELHTTAVPPSAAVGGSMEALEGTPAFPAAVPCAAVPLPCQPQT
jgi:hypothetical protein